MIDKRIMVNVTAWIVAHNASYTEIVESFWEDATSQGSAGMKARVKGLNETSSNHYALFEYHVWYADGGHGRYSPRDFQNLEISLGQVKPELAPSPLVPTPEA